MPPGALDDLTDPTSRAHAFPNPIDPTCSRSCAPIGPLRATTGSITCSVHGCRTSARVAWLMPSDQPEGRRHHPQRDLPAPCARSTMKVRPSPPGPSSAQPVLHQRHRSALAHAPRSDPTFCSPLSSHACPPARRPATALRTPDLRRPFPRLPEETRGRHPTQKMRAGRKMLTHTLTFLSGASGEEG